MSMYLYTHPDCENHKLTQHPERPERLRAVINRLEETGMTQDMKVKLADELSDDVLIQVHPSRYIETINRSEPTISTVRLDPDTYMSPGSLRAAKLAAGACVAAVSDILLEKTNRALCASLLACPFIIFAPLLDSVLLAWVCIGFYLFFISSFAPLGLIAVSGVSSGNVKGQMAAFHAFLMMVFGFSIGPQLTAFFTDFIFVDSFKLGWAISLTAVISLPLSALFFWFSLSKYRSTVEELRLINTASIK